MTKKLRLNQVALQRDLKITRPVGNIVIPDGQNYATIEATVTENGVRRQKSMQEVMEEIFSGDQNPQVVKPSIRIISVADINGSSINPKTDTFVGVGSLLHLQVSAILNDGSYGTLAATGVNFEKVEATLHVTGKEDVTLDVTPNEGIQNINFDFEEITLGDGEEAFVSIDARHTAGDTPLTQLGNPAPNYAIQAGTLKVESNKIKSFRPVFHGCLSTIISEPGELGDAILTNLEASNEPLESLESLLIHVGGDNGEILIPVIAIPGDEPAVEIEASLPLSLGAPVKDLVQIQAEIPGLNNYAPGKYTVFYWKPEVIEPGTEVKIIINQ